MFRNIIIGYAVASLGVAADKFNASAPSVDADVILNPLEVLEDDWSPEDNLTAPDESTLEDYDAFVKQLCIDLMHTAGVERPAACEGIDLKVEADLSSLSDIESSTEN